VIRLEFYNLKTKSKVEVEDSKITIVTTNNGRKAAQAEVDGMKLFKFLSKADAERLEGLTK
jgi:hypothetical protein